MPQKFKTGMVFGVYDTIQDRHVQLLKQAMMLCDKVVVAVSSDEEILALTKKPASVPLATRAQNVQHYCNQHQIPAVIIAEPKAYPADIVKKHIVDAYIISSSQYERFGKELESIIKLQRLLGKLVVI